MKSTPTEVLRSVREDLAVSHDLVARLRDRYGDLRQVDSQLTAIQAQIRIASSVVDAVLIDLESCSRLAQSVPSLSATG